MNSLRVIEPGVFTTVQDLGRKGYGPLGVSASGAADPIALRLGNRLVGNVEGAAALEMTIVGGAFEFSEGGVVALTGCDFGATLDGTPVPPWTSFEVRRGSLLRSGVTRSGARGYLCVRGGILVHPVLGSASTHVMTGLGGFEGRALRKRDVLTIGDTTLEFRKRTVSRRLLERLLTRGQIRVTMGEQADRFSEGSRRALCENTYRVSEQSNRMGIRLEGSPLEEQGGGEMITEGVALGAVQVPPGGLPIILFVEQQTTGGYPKIANVIAADLARLGQLRPRDEVHFEYVSLEQARALLSEQERLVTAREAIVE